MLPTLLILVAYLCGSLPTGVWLGRWAGVDVRRAGSGNIGATNVARTAGFRPALLTLLGDIAKGLVPTALARALSAQPRLLAMVALAAFIGHIFSVFLRFSGGKGVATGFGVCLALAPAAAAVAAGVFALVAFATRYVSLASVIAAAALPMVTVILGAAPPVSGAAGIIAAAIIIRHRSNLARLRAGIEPKFQVRKT